MKIGKFIIIVGMPLAVLGAILLPGTCMDLAPAKRAVVNATCHSIKTAAMGYYNVFSRFPFSDVYTNDFTFVESSILKVLVGENDNQNPKRTVFLEDKDYSSTNGLLDPWNNPFRIALDYSYDNRITLGERSFPQRVMVWSCGRNGKDEQGEGDDISTWK